MSVGDVEEVCVVRGESGGGAGGNTLALDGTFHLVCAGSGTPHQDHTPTPTIPR